MTKNYYIGVDIGTQSLRTGIFDENGKSIVFSASGYDLDDTGEWYTQPAKAWWHAFEKTLNECLENIEDNFDRSQIKALSHCSTSCTVLPTDKEGNALDDAILWMDQRAYKEADEINDKGHEILNYCGGKVSAEWMTPKMLWYKNNKNEIYEEADYFIECNDWFNFQLTNQWVTSKLNTSCRWNYVDIMGGWDDSYMEEIGLPDYKTKWPDKVIPIGQEIGLITPNMAEKLGLPKDLKIIQGGIDAHISLIGLGATKPNELGLIMGSSFCHLMFADNPVFKEGIWGPFSSPMIDKLWLLEGGQVSAASINRWFRDNFGQDYFDKESNFYEDMSKAASNIKAGSEGIVILDLWEGNRTPWKDPHASGNILGLKLKHSRAHVYRAILEGVAYGTRNVIEAMETKDRPIKKIKACGGASKDSLWLQIISNVTGKEIITTEFGEAGILGSAIIAAAGVEENTIDEIATRMVNNDEDYKPDMKIHAEYQDYFDVYKGSYQGLNELMKKLSLLNE